jgi:hypothetical protein
MAYAERDVRWGPATEELGDQAYELAHWLATPRDLSLPPDGLDGSPRWDYYDRRAFDAWLNFDGSAKLATPEHQVFGDGEVLISGVPEDERDQYLDYAVRLQAALPLSRGEQHWLAHVASSYGQAEAGRPDISGREPDIKLVDLQPVIFDAGIRRTLDGKELVRRWSQWRREIGSFEHQGSLAEARLAVESIARLILTPARISRLRQLLTEQSLAAEIGDER